MPIYRPWLIDEDNEQRIVVKDDRGDVVHHAEYSAMVLLGRETMQQERDNCHAMVAAINRIEPKTWRR